MSLGTAAIMVAVIALGTYLLRAAPMLLLADRRLPIPVQRALRNVGPAVLAALVAVTVAAGNESGQVPWAEMLALAAAGLVAWWRRNLIWSLAAGMGTFWITLLLA
jgi:branched-subunit amino acid transport protein